MAAADFRMTRRNLVLGAVASLICAPAIARAASLMPLRGLPFQFVNPERKIAKTVGEWYQLCFYNNLDNDLRAGRPITYGSIGGEKISLAEGYRIVAHARAEGWLPPYMSRAGSAHTNLPSFLGT